ncbi:hypothetical protein B566_EDAN010504 [Ephemera danica]|nr:hypothetical protein B566_EDAN010504 [Ephemera danica]
MDSLALTSATLLVFLRFCPTFSPCVNLSESSSACTKLYNEWAERKGCTVIRGGDRLRGSGSQSTVGFTRNSTTSGGLGRVSISSSAGQSPCNSSCSFCSLSISRRCSSCIARCFTSSSRCNLSRNSSSKACCSRFCRASSSLSFASRALSSSNLRRSSSAFLLSSSALSHSSCLLASACFSLRAKSSASSTLTSGELRCRSVSSSAALSSASFRNAVASSARSCSSKTSVTLWNALSKSSSPAESSSSSLEQLSAKLSGSFMLSAAVMDATQTPPKSSNFKWPDHTKRTENMYTMDLHDVKVLMSREGSFLARIKLDVTSFPSSTVLHDTCSNLGRTLYPTGFGALGAGAFFLLDLFRICVIEFLLLDWRRD